VRRHCLAFDHPCILTIKGLSLKSFSHEVFMLVPSFQFFLLLVFFFFFWVQMTASLFRLQSLLPHYSTLQEYSYLCLKPSMQICHSQHQGFAPTTNRSLNYFNWDCCATNYMLIKFFELCVVYIQVCLAIKY
jgi:hypothetical protein